MFLVLAVLLLVVAAALTYGVAYWLSDPKAQMSYSKLIGWLAGAAGLPFLGGTTYFAYRAGGEALSVAGLMVGILVMTIASVIGERQGWKSSARL